jgi:hypothetical protein
MVERDQVKIIETKDRRDEKDRGARYEPGSFRDLNPRRFT